ncbi:MAG: protein phosphatase 2C domain-containing protein [Polyangiales bacterium]
MTHPARFLLRVGASTHVGRRTNNEDALLAKPELGLFAVVDGMGGYEGGEVASRLVVEALESFFVRNAEDRECTWPCGLDPELSLEANELRVGLQLADLEVRLRKHDELRHMGATAVALVLRGSRVVVAHVGDSRVYRLRDGVLAQLTRDHSLLAMMEATEGRPIPKERAAQFAHIVTRAIGQSGNATPTSRKTAHGRATSTCCARTGSRIRSRPTRSRRCSTCRPRSRRHVWCAPRTTREARTTSRRWSWASRRRRWVARRERGGSASAAFERRGSPGAQRNPCLSSSWRRCLRSSPASRAAAERLPS